MRTLVTLLALSMALTACDKEKDSAKKDDDKSSSSSKKKKKSNPTEEFDGDEEGAKKLLKKLMNDEDSRTELSKALIPADDDYEAVFKDGDEAKKKYQKLFEKFGDSKIAPKEGQTELKLFSATSDELKDGEGAANNFPGGYKKAAGKFKKGITLYAWKFVKPGESLGMAYDGLTYVNGHWAWFPKPWMALGDE
jgi:hypothetical protein